MSLTATETATAANIAPAVDADSEGSISNGELRQLVCFRLNDEDFGIDIQQVQEINRMVDITRIPQSASYVEGVINLRGKIIPVINLRERFGFERQEVTSKETRIVVVETSTVTVGLVVDEVTEVLRLSAESIKPTPELAKSNVKDQYIDGVTSLSANSVEENGKQDRLLIVLNTARIFSAEETQSFRQMAEDVQS